MSDSGPHGLQPTRFLCPSNFPGKNTAVGCHFLLQGIFPTQGLNLISKLCAKKTAVTKSGINQAIDTSRNRAIKQNRESRSRPTLVCLVGF